MCPDVHGEPGAVEAGRRRPAPDVGHALELLRESNHAAAVGGWRWCASADGLHNRGRACRLLLCGEARRRLALQRRLLGRLLRLQPHDLAVDRAEQSAALAELALNRGPGGGALRDDLRLCGVVVLQPALALLHLAAQVRDLAEDERILLVDAVDRVDPG